jgi:hypothetical protein
VAMAWTTTVRRGTGHTGGVGVRDRE